MIIGFLPLDTRPCTYDLPVQLARQAGATVRLPPQGMMRHYKTGSDTRALSRWLEETAPKCDAFVISVEQLLYGGLIQSRQALVEPDLLMERLQVLRRVREKTPGLAIYLANVLMRTSISTLDSETLVWWEKVNRYSTLYYREKAHNDSGAARQCRQLEGEIPAKILQTFFAARRCGHEVNRTCIRLVAEGVAENLLVLQEDCAPEGVQRFEREILTNDIETLGLTDKVHMFNGTDEAGAQLLQKAINPEGCGLKVIWLGKQTDFTASYEDRPFRENLAGHLRSLAMREENGAQCVLFILVPRYQQREASQPCDDPTHEYSADDLREFSRVISTYSRKGRHCYLLDLDYANGGNVKFLEILSRALPIQSLWGYAAWNTASNALGTLLAQILASQSGNGQLNRAFTSERVLDDAIYQAIVRQTAAERLKARGEDIYNIKDSVRAEHDLQEAFEGLRPLMDAIFNGEVPAFEAKLRWPRLFEAAIFTQSGGGPVFVPDTKNV